MLQRAASNAYSWWWASHIRTKQSKWMEQNLQDMEEKVQAVLKLIEEDGDSFAKRAEMYYKKRPELIHFVEESYRAYRALAERYDHISTELQNANTTIASVFPEQVQFAMEDDEDDSSPRFPRKPPPVVKGNIPKVPKIPKDVKGIFTSATKSLQSKKSMRKTNTEIVAKSGLSKSEGLQDIDRLQKQILALQTEKEFVKSSYEGGLAKYWEIEQKITKMQEKVCSLQDEFGAGMVIEDDEARMLMASAALKSCQETLSQLEEKHEKSAEEAITECKRIDDAQEKLKAIKDEFLNGESIQEKPNSKAKAVGKLKISDKDPSTDAQDRQDLELLREKIKKQFEVGSSASLSVTDLAEKIDQLVNKVISLEAAVSSQTALIQRLRTETDELQAQIGILEDDKATLTNGKNDLTDKLREMEEKLLGLQELNRSVEHQNNNLETHFTEAHYNLGHLSEKLHDVKPDEELQATPQSVSGSMDKSQEQVKGREGALTTDDNLYELQELKSEEESNTSRKAHEELRGQESMLKRDDSADEKQKMQPHEELKISNSSCALTIDDSLHELQELKSEESNTSGKAHEELRGQESMLKPDDSADETQKMKMHEELKLSNSLQKEKEFFSEVHSQTGLKMQEEKVNTNEESRRDESALDPDASLDKQQPHSQAKLKTQEGKLSTDEESRREESELGPDDNLDKQRPHTQAELKTQEGKVNTESRREESALDPDGILDNQQHHWEIDVSTQKENATNKEEEKKENNVSTSNRNESKNATTLQMSNDPDNHLDKSLDVKMEEAIDKQAETQEQPRENDDDEPDWKNLFTNGMENREKTLLSEYTAVLRNYKEVKKKLAESEKKNGDGLFDVMIHLRELKSSNAKKDEQIKLLRQKLSLLTTGLGEDSETLTESPRIEKDAVDEVKVIMMEEPEISPIEKKFRMSIDELLEENLDFWLRFSSTFHQIQKFETEIKDLQSELLKLEEKKKKQDGSTNVKYSLKSDAKPLYKHLREIHTELTVWLEKSALLKDELKSRFSSLCDIQEEMTAALKESAEDEDFKFTSYQAAKFQGEILNMKQENNKVADELQAGLDHVTTLQLEAERTLAKLNEEFKLAGSKHQQNIQLQHSDSRSRVPLRSFIFGTKAKKQKHSIFSCVHPVLQRKYNGFKSGTNV